MNQTKKIELILLAFLLVFSSSVFALTIPDGLQDKISTTVKNGWNYEVGVQGWSQAYGMPEKQFSGDTKDYFSDFGETGLFALAAGAMNELEILKDLNADKTISSKMNELASNMLKWQWTASGSAWGAKDQEVFPSGKKTHVIDKLTGAYGSNSECKNIDIPFNLWAFPKDTVTTSAETDAMQLEGAIIALLNSRELSSDSSVKENLKTAAVNAGNILLSITVTPDGEAFGINESKLADKYNLTVPVGMIGHHLEYNFAKTDSAACSDAGNIRLNETYKRELVFGAIAFQKLFDATTDARYQTAENNAMKLLYAERECDGTFKMYVRWQGSGSSVNIECIDDTGSTTHPYEQHVVVASETNALYDTAYILFLTQQLNQNSYKDNPEFKDSVNWLLQIEEQDTIGAGVRRNNADRIYSSTSQEIRLRGFVQALLGDLFLRSSCTESDSSVKARLEGKGVDLVDKSLNLINITLDPKPAYATETDVGKNSIGLEALAESWNIMTNGCKKCEDKDGDGFKDASCTQKPAIDDCDDSDPAVHPGAKEVCDNKDDDCNGKVDDVNGNIYACHPAPAPIVPPTDANFEITVQEGSAPVEGAEVNLFNTTSVCVKSFKLESAFLDQILANCNSESTCTTDSNGNCTARVGEAGSYIAIAKKGNSFYLLENQEIALGDHKVLSLSGGASTGSASPLEIPLLKDNFYAIIGAALVIVLIIIALMVTRIQKPKIGMLKK